MSTIYDFTTLAIFIGLVGMFLQFSRKEDQDILAYIWPMLGCAVGNYLGNEGFEIAAWALIVTTLLYIFFKILKPEGVADKVDKS